MGFCHRCGDLVHGANCLKCGGRSVMSVTSGLQSTGSRNDPWISAYQNILDGGISKTSRRMSMPAASTLSKPQSLVVQKQCHGCSKPIHQAKVFVEPGRPHIMHCEKCYVEKFTKGNCPSCFKPVLSKTDLYITHNKRSWHTDASVLIRIRPGSALSIHSYTSSRASSPGLERKEQDYDNDARPARDDHEISSEPTLPGLRRSRSRSMVGLEDLDTRLVRRNEDSPTPSRNGSSRSDSGSQRGSLPGTPGRKSPVMDRYPASIEADIVTPTERMSLSTSDAARPLPEQQIPPKSRLSRVRSRSSVVPSTTGMVRARTEALLNQAQSTTSSTSRNISQHFNSSHSLYGSKDRVNGVGMDTKTFSTFDNASKQMAKVPEKATKSWETRQPEAEPNRSPLHRHGRQRSNTVGEAIDFPAVRVDSLASPTFQRGSIPENHCHKCLEKVVENGIRLQNGDRYHIGCFLCHGCKQVFTESEFHIVFGRPYHPNCVSMAGTTSMVGLTTKCHQCQKSIGNKSIRFAGVNYHPQCFTCTHCHKVLHSTSRFFEVEGRVECEQCCEERDRQRLAPKIVPVARGTDHFPVPPVAVPVAIADQGRRNNVPLEPSGPGMMAKSDADGNLSRSGSGFGSPRSVSGASTPHLSPESPSSKNPISNVHEMRDHDEVSSPVLLMASPLAIRSEAPALTSLFSTRTRPLPKFGGVMTCPRCHQPVGVMDQVPGPDSTKWHKKCLNCKGCKKALDSSAQTRGEGEAYCRGCFDKTRIRV
ncbi:hypothetical protein BGZ50_005718 [Haplosporangium sp. Z 11]|nr:hypothetical protein BGZ50_005718 [Haplosporangium sp. Z 11]